MQRKKYSLQTNILTQMFIRWHTRVSLTVKTTSRLHMSLSNNEKMLISRLTESRAVWNFYTRKKGKIIYLRFVNEGGQ